MLTSTPVMLQWRSAEFGVSDPLEHRSIRPA
jgi:hypothetical protein